MHPLDGGEEVGQEGLEGEAGGRGEGDGGREVLRGWRARKDERPSREPNAEK